METFSALLAICAGSSVTGHRWIPLQMPVTRSFDVFFDLHLNTRLSKQWWGWWFETPSRLLWRHCNGNTMKLARCYTQSFRFYQVLLIGKRVINSVRLPTSVSARTIPDRVAHTSIAYEICIRFSGGDYFIRFCGLVWLVADNTIYMYTLYCITLLLTALVMYCINGGRLKRNIIHYPSLYGHVALCVWIKSLTCQLHCSYLSGSVHWHMVVPVHDDVIKWKHFPRYWPFVWGIHRWPVNSPHKGQWRGVWCFLWSAPE